jgi:hypothetical protein
VFGGFGIQDEIMSDPPPPPANKVGSLRDRIAQFEQQSQSSAPAGPAPGAPAPGRFKAREWKPRPKTPPSPASNANANAGANAGADSEDAGSGVASGEASVVVGDGEKSRGGSGVMNAGDAKETIGLAGGSLKERTAALRRQGELGPADGELLSSLFFISFRFYVPVVSCFSIPPVVIRSLAAFISLSYSLHRL